jgi:ATP-dependent Clp protease ATP-binding subunit ClpA
VIQTELENPLAEEILSGRFLPGQHISVRKEGIALSFLAKKENNTIFS